MSTSALPPTAPTTLVVILGASTWPYSPGFQASKAFVHAAQEFKDYVLDPQGFDLPTANLLNLFNAFFSASNQLEMLGSFLEQRAQALEAANQAVRDVIVYFVGHGGFAGSSADFYLLPRRANASSLRASGLPIDALAEVLREKTRQTRRYLFLDCCFAAAAFRTFQGGPDQTAITKTLDAFAVQTKSSGFPRRGTALLCSSDQKSPSLLMPDESSTMFSYALLDVLKNGDFHWPLQLSLRDVKELVGDRLAALPEKNAPRPGLYSPDQSEGDTADIPFFPNPRSKQARLATELNGAAEELTGKSMTEASNLIEAPAEKPTAGTVNSQVGEKMDGRKEPTTDTAPSLTSTVSSSLLSPTSNPLPSVQQDFVSPSNPLPSAFSSTQPQPVPVGTRLLRYKGHGDAWKAFAWSPDSQYLIVGTYAGEVQLWNAVDWGLIRTWGEHDESVRVVAWSPDGRSVVSCSGDKTVRVWDSTTGQQILTYTGHTGNVLAVAWAPDGQRVASGSTDQTVQIWDACTGDCYLSYKHHKDPVRAVSWASNGQKIVSAASGEDDKTAQVWDASTGQCLAIYKRHQEGVEDVLWSPADDRVVSLGSWKDKTVQVWDSNTGQHLFTYTGHQGEVKAVAWSPDGHSIASGSSWKDRSVHIWEASTGQHLFTYTGHEDPVETVVWSSDGQKIASQSSTLEVQIWDVSTGRLLFTHQGDSPHIHDVKWSPDGGRVASCSRDVQIWDARTSQTTCTRKYSKDEIYEIHSSTHALVWSPDGSKVASASRKNSVEVWNSSTGRYLCTYLGHSNAIACLAWSPDGSKIASGSYDDEVHLWEAKNGRHLFSYKGHASTVNAVAWSPNGRWLASGSGHVGNPESKEDNTVQIWDATTGRCLHIYRDHHSAVTAVVWAPDGSRIAYSSGYLDISKHDDDNTVQVWDVSTGRRILTYTGHVSKKGLRTIQAITWSPDGRWLASGGWDGTVQIWDANTALHRFTYEGDRWGGVNALAWSPDSSRIAVTLYGVVDIFQAI